MKGANGCQGQQIPPGAEGAGSGEPPNAGAGSGIRSSPTAVFAFANLYQENWRLAEF